MTTIPIADLRDRLDEVIDQIARDGEPITVLRDGIQVAELNPTVTAPERKSVGVAPQWTDDQIDA